METNGARVNSGWVRAIRIYLETMAALCAVQFLYAADSQLTNLLSRSNPMVILALVAETYLGIGNLFEMIGGWIFGLASGRGEWAQASGKLGFYLMTPLALASLNEFAAKRGLSGGGIAAYTGAVLAYFALYGVGFYFFAVMWPAFLWAILFKLGDYRHEPYLTLRRDTWRATLLCVALVALTILVDLTI